MSWFTLIMIQSLTTPKGTSKELDVAWHMVKYSTVSYAYFNRLTVAYLQSNLYEATVEPNPRNS